MNDETPESGGGHPAWMASLLGETLPEAPYPGLRPFEADEEVIFFGRDQHVNAVLRRLAKGNFVAVVGPSGCGKSSLVKAGVVPALEAGRYYEAGTDWAVAQVRPGTAPLWNLARALLLKFESEHEPDPARIADASAVLAGSEKPLTTLLRELGVPQGRNVLIIIDQFEELFRYEAQSIDAEEGDDFVSLLLSIQRAEEENASCIITMRTDHFGDCTRFQGLPEAINETLFLTPRMDERERRAAIEGPVRLFGDQITPELTDTLIRDMHGVDDQLPLMQHVLLRMWRAASMEGSRKGVTLDREAYDRLGGLKNALDRHAGEVMDEIGRELGAEGGRLTELLFRQLTERRDDSAGQDVRRPMRLGPLADACGIADPAGRTALETVVQTFVRPDVGFLRLEGAGDVLDDDTLIDIVHECLIRKWSSLQGWVAQEWEAAKKLRDLITSAGLRRGTGTFLNADDTTYFARWREETQPNANWAGRYGVAPEALDEALAFLDASIAQVEDQKKREHDQVEREARDRERAKRRKFTVAGIVLFVVALLGAVYEIDRRAQARYEARIKEFYTLQKKLSELIHSESRANAENMLGLLKQTGAQATILEGFVANPRLRFAQLERLSARKAKISADSAETMDRAMRVSRELELEREARGLITDHKEEMEKLAASFDAHIVQLHSEVQRDIRNIPRARGASLRGNFSAVAIRPDGLLLALAEMREVGTGESKREALAISLRAVPGAEAEPGAFASTLAPGQLADASVLEMIFSPDGRYLAATVAAFGPDGQELVWILVWDVRKSAPVERIVIPWTVTDYAGMALAIGRDSRTVAIATAGGRYLICEIGRCAGPEGARAYRTGRVRVKNQSAAITEDLAFLSLVPIRDGAFLALYFSQQSTIWAYRLALGESAAEASELISEPAYRLPWMPQFRPKPRGEGEAIRYCAAQDTLVAMDQQATGLLAWNLSGTGPPECAMWFDHAAPRGPIEIWQAPRDAARWPTAVAMAPATSWLFKGWEDRARVARLDKFKDLVSGFRFPFQIVQFQMDRAGRTLVTRALPEPAPDAARESDTPSVSELPIVSLWRSLAGHHVAFLGKGDAIADAAIGFDAGSKRVLWAKTGGPVHEVRLASGGGDRAAGSYRFDAARLRFVPDAPDRAAVPAVRWSDALAVKVVPAGSAGGATVSLESGGRVVKSFEPKRLWRHDAGQIAFGFLSGDGGFAAVSVPGGGGEETDEPALEIWDTRTGELKARVLHKSKVIGGTFLDGGRYVATLTERHGAWLSVWRLDDLKVELCGRLKEYDVAQVPLGGERDVCAGG